MRISVLLVNSSASVLTHKHHSHSIAFIEPNNDKPFCKNRSNALVELSQPHAVIKCDSEKSFRKTPSNAYIELLQSGAYRAQ